MNPHVRLWVGLLVDRLIGLSVIISSKRGKLHFDASIGARFTNDAGQLLLDDGPDQRGLSKPLPHKQISVNHVRLC